jgi:ADP-heptose:LPS heptosyltransferase
VAGDVYHWVLPEPVAGRHQTGVNLDLVTPFGAPADDWRPEIDLEEALAAQGWAALDTTLGPHETSSKRIVMHPGAGKLPNRWPAERFGQVARTLTAAGHRVAIATGPGETDLFERVDAGAGRAMPRLPGLPLHAVAGAIGSADLLLANDTGVLHLGAAVGVPTLTFFGPTDPRQWCPAAPRLWYLAARDGDLEALPTVDVEQSSREILDHLAGGPEPGTATAAPRPSAEDAPGPDARGER